LVKPDVITGYNSENFDWPFLFERADILGMDITEFAITLIEFLRLNVNHLLLNLVVKPNIIYKQTCMGSILDISHAVRRAMAINSEKLGLKYITQYSEIAKPNRVYVPGDKINTTWADKVNKYAFNDNNGDWYKITDSNP
jgi:DNA polymerase elongation subunit (family B)